MKLDGFFRTLFILLLLICAQSAQAQGEDAGHESLEAERPRYRMELVWLVDGDDAADPGRYVFIIGSLGFKTVEGLKGFVRSLPEGAVLEWSPGCLRRGEEPLLSSSEELEDFKRFCRDHGVEFILHPSG